MFEKERDCASSYPASDWYGWDRYAVRCLRS